MGTPFAVTVANTFMYHHEKDMKIVDQYSNYPTLYRRFISLWTGSLFWEGMKKSRGEGRKRVRASRQTFEVAIPHSCLLVADHLSARSLSVTWIHWNVINFACKKGVGRQHTPFTSYQNAVFFQWVFSALEGLVLIEKMWFLPLISYWEVVTRILIFCGYCFRSAWFALWCKNIHCG